jgi:hypothetical protein
MTKELRTSWMRIGVAAILIASSIVFFVTGNAGTEQLVIQGLLAVLGVGLLVQGVTGLVAARRR